MQMGPILRIAHRSAAEAANAVSALADTEPAAPAASIAGPGAPTASRCTTSGTALAGSAGRRVGCIWLAELGRTFTFLLQGGWEGNTWYLQPLYLKVSSPHSKIHQVGSSSIIERGLRYLVGWKMINAYPCSYERTPIFMPSYSRPPSQAPVPNAGISFSACFHLHTFSWDFTCVIVLWLLNVPL